MQKRSRARIGASVRAEAGEFKQIPTNEPVRLMFEPEVNFQGNADSPLADRAVVRMAG
jgi:hypothetical protein